MATLRGLDGSGKGAVALGRAFAEPVRPDLIRRAVLAERSQQRQQYASNPLAGKRSSAHYHGLRHYRYTMMNREMARLPRIHGRVGYLHFTARIAPHARKGREAHPPQLRAWVEKINRKEWRKALRSALAASAVLEVVRARGHQASEAPLVVDDGMQMLTKTRDVLHLLAALKLSAEIERSSIRRIRGGKGKLRNRKHKGKVGPLLIVAEDKGLGRACQGIPGVGCVRVQRLTVSDLAPGGQPGRLCVWSESALKAVETRAGA